MQGSTEHFFGQNQIDLMGQIDFDAEAAM